MKLKIPEKKAFWKFESRTSVTFKFFGTVPFIAVNKNKVIIFDLSYLPVAAVGTEQVRYHEKIVKNIKDDFKKCFSWNF